MASPVSPPVLERNGDDAEVIIIGGGLAGLSAAIYLARSLRSTLVIDSGKSMAAWEPDVQNYLGFPAGISGEELIHRGRKQAERFHVRFAEDEVIGAEKENGTFVVRAKNRSYHGRRLLIATGIFHLPPDIEGVHECLGHSMYFCKDCDGYRNQGKALGIYGWNNLTVDYALGMLVYSPVVAIVSNGHSPEWDDRHATWLDEYKIPVYSQRISRLNRNGCNLRALCFEDGSELVIESLFTTKGDIYFNKIAKGLGAEIDQEGQIVVNENMATTVTGMYAAGCVTPANCQMIIAAGQGAVAAQAINRDLFEESLRNHALRRFRENQLDTVQTRPVEF